MEDVVVPGMKMLHYRSNSDSFFLPINSWKKHGCILSIVATDALVLKHQAISVHSTDWIFFVVEHFHTEIVQLQWTVFEI